MCSTKIHEFLAPALHLCSHKPIKSTQKNIQRIQAELAIQQDNAMFFKTRAGISHQRSTSSEPFYYCSFN